MSRRDLQFVWGSVLGLLAAVILVGVFVGCESTVAIRTKVPTPPISTPARPVAVEQVQVLAFTSNWCNQCQFDKPELDKLRRKGIEVIEIDTVRNPELARRYGVERLPTYVVLQDGVEIKRTEFVFSLLAILGLIFAFLF